MVFFNLLFITYLILSNAFAQPKIVEMKIVIPESLTEIVDDKDYERDDASSIRIILAANDRIYWYVGKPNYEDYESLKEIGYEELQSILKEHADYKPVVIMTTKDATYENLTTTLDKLRISGIPRYTITDITDAEVFLIGNYKTKGALSDSLAATPQ